MKVAILGCGWIGLELARYLKSRNYEVKGSVTRMERMEKLQQNGIVPYNIKLFENGIQGDITSFLSGMEALVVDIPPGLRKKSETNFLKKMQNLVPYIEKSGIKKLVYTSSTSVYKDTNEIPEYTEESETDNTNDAAIQLKNVELLFVNNPNFDASVLRFGGLLGKDRHPITYLSGKTGVKNAKAPVNLVHKNDCVAALALMLKLEEDNTIWNLVYPQHPEREEYYTRVAREKGLAIPEFEQTPKSSGKKISSSKIMDKLNFKFENPI